MSRRVILSWIELRIFTASASILTFGLYLPSRFSRLKRKELCIVLVSAVFALLGSNTKDGIRFIVHYCCCSSLELSSSPSLTSLSSSSQSLKLSSSSLLYIEYIGLSSPIWDAQKLEQVDQGVCLDEIVKA
jgi:hypothetical protein